MAAVWPAAWGLTNRTEIVALDNGDQVVVQSYRRRADAAYRLAEMRRLHKPATEAGIPLPEVRAADLDDEPPWVIYQPTSPRQPPRVDGRGEPTGKRQRPIRARSTTRASRRGGQNRQARARSASSL
jgi:hypothetical protein